MTTEADCQGASDARADSRRLRTPGPARSPEPRADWMDVREGVLASRAEIAHSLSTAASLTSDGVLSRRPSTASAHLSRAASAASDGR